MYKIIKKNIYYQNIMLRLDLIRLIYNLHFRRDGFQIRAVANEADEITINFKTGNNVQRSGFSCLVYTHAKGKYFRALGNLEN